MSPNIHVATKRWWPMAAACLWVIGAGGAPGAYGLTLNDFDEFNYDYNSDSSIDLPGRILRPPDVSHPRPLVIFYHGSGECGADNVKQLDNNLDGVINGSDNVGNLLAKAVAHDFIVYAPQNNIGTLWQEARLKYSLMMAAKAVGQYNIDPNRIYVTGLSLGGGGTWALHSYYPDVVAASVPICGGSTAAFIPSALVGKAIWAFHAVNDNTPGADYTKSRTRVQQIRLADDGTTVPMPPPFGAPYYADTSGRYYEGNGLRYSEYTSGGHGIWGRVYNGGIDIGSPDIYGWMLSKSQAMTAVQPGETILFDFGAVRQAEPDTAGRHWNSVARNGEAGYQKTEAPAMPFAVTTAGRTTLTCLEVTNAFPGVSSSGLASPLYGSAVASDSWQTNYPDYEGKFRIRGLTPGGRYQLKFYASHGSANSAARYEVGSLYANPNFVELVALGNTSNQAVLEDVTADGAGMIEVTVARAGSATHAHLGVLELAALVTEPEPAFLFLQNLDAPGTTVASLTSIATPELNRLNDISQEANGGTWSVAGGALQLDRPGLPVGSTGGAGFTRFPAVAEEGPSVAAVRFRVGVTGTAAAYSVLGKMGVGQFTATGDYSGAGYYGYIANDISIRMVGGPTYRLEINGAGTASSFPLDGTMREVLCVTNRSGSSINYQGPDGMEYALATGRCDLWVEGARLPNISLYAYFTSNKMGGLRFHSNTDQAVTIRLDEIELLDLTAP